MQPEADLPIQNIQLNKGLYITDSEEDENTIYIYDKYVEDNYWNYAYLKQPVLNLDKIKNYFHSKNIPASAYFLDDEKFKNIETTLTSNGFSLSYTDAIMTHYGNPISLNTEHVIEEVKTQGQQDDFVKVYSDVFVDEGEDVYSGLSDGYVNNIQDYFANYPKDKRYDLTTYKNQQPAGIATVVFNNQYALIMNVAVSPKYRKQGIAKALSIKCISEFKDRVVFLSTEKDSIDEDIYRRMGFSTVAIGKCYKEVK
jgi:ribosomal protein S18 acetylase RimI-like enzyme